MTRIEITFITENKDGKQLIQGFQTETLLTATRMMLGFKPNRGYKVVKTTIEEIEVLV